MSIRFFVFLVWKNWTMWQREDVACENGTNVFRRPCLNFIHETANISNCIKRGADPQPPDRWCNEYEGCVYQYKNVTNVTGILCIGKYVYKGSVYFILFK